MFYHGRPSPEQYSTLVHNVRSTKCLSNFFNINYFKIIDWLKKKIIYLRLSQVWSYDYYRVLPNYIKWNLAFVLINMINDWWSLLDIRLVKEMNCSRPLTTCTWGWQKLAGRFVIKINNAEIEKIANAKENIALICIVVSKVNRDRSFLNWAWALIK